MNTVLDIYRKMSRLSDTYQEEEVVDTMAKLDALMFKHNAEVLGVGGIDVTPSALLSSTRRAYSVKGVNLFKRDTAQRVREMRAKGELDADANEVEKRWFQEISQDSVWGKPKSEAWLAHVNAMPTYLAGYTVGAEDLGCNYTASKANALILLGAVERKVLEKTFKRVHNQVSFVPVSLEELLSDL